MLNSFVIHLFLTIIYLAEAQQTLVFYPGGTNNADSDEVGNADSIKLWNDNETTRRSIGNERQAEVIQFDNQRSTNIGARGNTNLRNLEREATFRDIPRTNLNDRSSESSYDRPRDNVQSRGRSSTERRKENDSRRSYNDDDDERSNDFSRSQEHRRDSSRRSSASTRSYDDDRRSESRTRNREIDDDERDYSRRSSKRKYDDSRERERDRDRDREYSRNHDDDDDWERDSSRKSSKKSYDSRDRPTSRRNSGSRYDDDDDDFETRRESRRRDSDRDSYDSNRSRNRNRDSDRDRDRDRDDYEDERSSGSKRRNSNSRERSRSADRRNTYDDDWDRGRNRDRDDAYERETRKIDDFNKINSNGDHLNEVATQDNPVIQAIDSAESDRSNSKESSSNRRLCERKYAEYMVRIFPNEADTEADSNDDDFDGRKLAAPGEYPHMCALGFATVLQQTEYKCGGSLISENFVITAAHCTNLSGQAPTKVRIGDLDLKVKEKYLEPQVYSIMRIFRHPDYKKDTYYNDIALLQLNQTVEFTEFVRPIRLWVNPVIKYEVAYAMGYGATGFSKQITHRLTHLNLTIVPNVVCNEELPVSDEAPQGIIESQICGQDYELNRDTCQGDSGGPLQLNLFGRRHQNRKHYHLIGITSYGVFCRSHHPSVYTRVSAYLDWIESVVWNNQF